MVVRLGQASNVEVVQRYRIRQGMALQLQYVSSETVIVRAWARIRYDNGEDDILFVPDQSLGNDRAITLARPSDVARFDGWVTDALVELPLDATIKRGQVYVRLFMDPFGPLLCKDYVYSNFGQVALGTYIQDGPGGGGGNLEIVTISPEGAPVASTKHTFAATNEIREIRGYAWYYVASADVASRVIEAKFVNPLGAVPTGFADPAAEVINESGAITVTASDEALISADTRRSRTNDDGVIANEKTTMLPLIVTEGDPLLIDFQVTDGHANDLDVIYLLRESWVIEL